MERPNQSGNGGRDCSTIQREDSLPCCFLIPNEGTRAVRRSSAGGCAVRNNASLPSCAIQVGTFVDGGGAGRYLGLRMWWRQGYGGRSPAETLKLPSITGWLTRRSTEFIGVDVRRSCMGFFPSLTVLCCVGERRRVLRDGEGMDPFPNRLVSVCESHLVSPCSGGKGSLQRRPGFLPLCEYFRSGSQHGTGL